MDTNNDVSEVLTPSHSPGISRQIIGVPVELLIALTLWICGCAFMLTRTFHCSPWLAVPVSMPLGVVLFVASGKAFSEFSDSVLELAIGATVGLILFLILIPIFAQARLKSERLRQRMTGPASSPTFDPRLKSRTPAGRRSPFRTGDENAEAKNGPARSSRRAVLRTPSIGTED